MVEMNGLWSKARGFEEEMVVQFHQAKRNPRGCAVAEIGGFEVFMNTHIIPHRIIHVRQMCPQFVGLSDDIGSEERYVLEDVNMRVMPPAYLMEFIFADSAFFANNFFINSLSALKFVRLTAFARCMSLLSYSFSNK